MSQDQKKTESMRPGKLADGRVIHCEDHVVVDFPGERPVLSSAVLNGGRCSAQSLLIMRVDENFAGDADGFEHPQATLRAYADHIGLNRAVVGMMTSASMNSCRVVEEEVDGIELGVVLTAGVSNARCIGDRAECRDVSVGVPAGGTINIVMATTARLTPSAMVECVMMVTEAKAHALHRLGIRSPVTDHMATGTGTDSVAIVSGEAERTVTYCGKHTIFGETLGRCVIEGLQDSLREARWGEVR